MDLFTTKSCEFGLSEKKQEPWEKTKPIKAFPPSAAAHLAPPPSELAPSVLCLELGGFLGGQARFKHRYFGEWSSQRDYRKQGHGSGCADARLCNEHHPRLDVSPARGWSRDHRQNVQF